MKKNRVLKVNNRPGPNVRFSMKSDNSPIRQFANPSIRQSANAEGQSANSFDVSIAPSDQLN